MPVAKRIAMNMGVFRNFHFLMGNLGQERDVVYTDHFPYRNGISNVKSYLIAHIGKFSEMPKS